MSFNKRKFDHNETIKQNNYLTDSFRENRKFAEQLKERWNKPVDPILQRGDQYIQREKPIQQCKLNYFQRMKQKEQQIKPRSIHNNYSTLYKETINKDNINISRKKIFTENEKKPKRREIENQHIKIYPDQYTKSKIGKILHSTGDENEKVSNIKRKEEFTPSEDYVKMNNKFKLLPSENRGDSINIMRRRYTKDGLKDTQDRLFNVNPVRPCSATPKIRLIHKIEVKEKTDHITDLISYHYAPKFKEIKYTDKPNHSNYTTVVNRTIDNLNENFITETYNYK